MTACCERQLRPRDAMISEGVVDKDLWVAHKRSCGRCGSLQNLVLKGHAFGIVFLKPFFRGVRGGEGRTGAFPQE